MTVLTTILAAAAGLSPGRLAMLFAAVLCGQLTIGWLNDLRDAPDDRSAGRTDKPLATGRVSPRTVRAAFPVAALGCVTLSLALGVLPGAAHLLFVAAGWAYDLGVKRSAASFLPYLAGFGILPAVPLSAAGAAIPPALLLAGGLLGVGAHFFNVLPDMDADREAGVRSLPVRLGPGRTRLFGCALLVASAVLLMLARPEPVGSLPPGSWLAFSSACVCAGAAAAFGRLRTSRLPFLVAVGAAAADVVLLIGLVGALGARRG